MSDKASLGSLETKLNSIGRCSSDQHGFINCPIYRGSTTLYKTMDDSVNARAEFKYGTHGNPTVANLQKAWTSMTGGAGTLIVSSGMAAIALALLTVTKSGDNLLVTDSVYQPARNFCNGLLQKMGVQTTYYDPLITGEELRELIEKYPNTSAILLESPGSQTFDIQDIPSLTAVAREFGVVSIVDNTWATPLFFDAHGKGCDISVEAGTKYLGGHSDLLLGMVSANEKWYPEVKKMFSLFQAPPGNEDCFLALRGLRTMYIRIKEAEKRALDVASFLQGREEVLKVLHPALPDFPGYELWKRDFTGSSGLFSIVLQGKYTLKDVERMVDGLKVFGIGFSWGGFESLVLYQDCNTSRSVTNPDLGGTLLRLYIGLEGIEDIKNDLVSGLERLNSNS